MKEDYHINIFYSAEDEGYIADIPDLEACSASLMILYEYIPKTRKSPN